MSGSRETGSPGKGAKLRGKRGPFWWEVLTLSFLWLLYGGFPGGSDSKQSACNVGDLGSIPGSGRYPGEGTGPTQ